MKKEKHEEILKEVLDEIGSALNDKRGLLSHQRRLAFSLSLGAVNLIELYFHKLSIIKGGTQIDHTWFKRSENRILEKLQTQITGQIDSIENIKKIIDIAKQIEEKRDDLAYGAPASDKILQEKINLFFMLKKVVKC